MSSSNDGANSIGLALASGGNRANAACTAILRGFQQKQIKTKDGKTCPAMDAVKYNSGVSGGSISAALYTFAQVPTDLLLETDRLVDPEAITPELLEMLPETSMGYAMTKHFLRLPALYMLPFLFANIFKLNSWWSGIVYRNCMLPLNIPRDKFFASSKEEVQEIVKNNPNLREQDFLLPRAGVKTMPMILFTMRGIQGDSESFRQDFDSTTKSAGDKYKIEEALNSYTKNFEGRPDMTKYVLKEAKKSNTGALLVPYTVTPIRVNTMFKGTMKMDGKEFKFPAEDTKPALWGKGSRFSIEAATAMCTNFLPMIGPRAEKLTNTREVDCGGHTSVMEFADGGYSDPTGILPLVQAKIRNIICVYNFNEHPPFVKYCNTYADFYKAAPSLNKNSATFDADFREWMKRLHPDIAAYFGFFGNYGKVLNHVFHDPNLDRLKELMVKYNSLFKAGEPLIATLHDLEVIENPFWGTVAGEKVDLTFIYMNMPKQFSEKVPIECVPPPDGMEKIDEHGQFNNEDMKVVPELPWDPPVAGLQYTKQQVNMMSYLGSWMIDRAWDGLKSDDGKVQFEGFKDIFEAE